MSIPLTSVTLSNNSATVTVNSPSINLSSVQSGWMIFIDGYSVPLEIASGGQDLLTLADTYTGATLTARIAVVVETKAALTDAIEAINLLGNQLVTAKDDYQVALDAQGTAATHTVTTSTTDTAANRLLKVGDFGIGTTTPPVVSNLDTHTSNGMFAVTSSSAVGLPVARIGSLIQSGRTGSRRIQIFLSDGDESRMYQRFEDAGGWQAWVEIYHSGNTNFNEFACNSADDVLATGFAANTTTGIFYLPLNSKSAPQTVTLTPTTTSFDVYQNNVLVGSAVTPSINSQSSNKILVLILNGLSNLTLGAPLQLKGSASNSKITVNF